MGYYYELSADEENDYKLNRTEILEQSLTRIYDRCICEIEMAVAVAHYTDEFREYAALLDICFNVFIDGLFAAKRGES